jgi:hypothetical protein
LILYLFKSKIGSIVDDDLQDTSDSDWGGEDSRAFFRALEPFKLMDFDEPQIARRYPLISRTHINSDDLLYRDLNWPNKSDCEITRPQLVQRQHLPHIFVSPENKGFM